jgi:hypothetical protein
VKQQKSEEIYYLAGPMSEISDHNHPEFDRVQLLLQHRGMQVVSPHSLSKHLTPQRRDLIGRAHWVNLSMRLLLAANRIVLLSGWELSAGARLELDVALDLEYPAFLLDEFDRLIKLTGKRVEA